MQETRSHAAGSHPVAEVGGGDGDSQPNSQSLKPAGERSEFGGKHKKKKSEE